MKAKILTTNQIKSLSKELPGWSVGQDMIQRHWRFKNFVEAFGFISRIALIAESMNHHPKFINVYSLVTIELSTHDLGGLSNKDAEMAAAIYQL